ncbi:thiamine phosphate synthase [Thermaurantiacus sp.]
MTDERLGPDLAAAVRALPRGSGVVLRHYGQTPPERQRLAIRLRTLCRRRGHLLLVAEPPPGVKADGVHLPARTRRRPFHPRGLVTAAVHDAREAARARALGAELLFVSPVFATASHPGVRGLGPLRFAVLARAARLPVIALGGMNPRRFRQLKPLGARGYAATDFWKRPAGPAAP